MKTNVINKISELTSTKPEDLHLEHVLMAVEEEWETLLDEDQQNRTVGSRQVGQILAKYNLSKPFNEQEDAVFDLLANMLDV